MRMSLLGRLEIFSVPQFLAEHFHGFLRCETFRNPLPDRILHRLDEFKIVVRMDVVLVVAHRRPLWSVLC